MRRRHDGQFYGLSLRRDPPRHSRGHRFEMVRGEGHRYSDVNELYKYAQMPSAGEKLEEVSVG